MLTPARNMKYFSFSLKAFSIMSITLFIAILYIEAEVSSQFQINVIYTDLQPFIFTQADGTVDGIIPLQLRQGEKICNNTGNISYVNKLDLLNKLQQIGF